MRFALTEPAPPRLEAGPGLQTNSVQAGKNGSAGVDARYFQTDKEPEPSAFAALHAKRESVVKVLDLNYIGQLE